MPAANKNILHLFKATTGLLPVAMSIGIMLAGETLIMTPAFADTQPLSMATATLTQSEAADAMAHSVAANPAAASTSTPVPVQIATATPMPSPASVSPAALAPHPVASDDDDDDDAALAASDHAATVMKPAAPAAKDHDDDSADEQTASSGGSWFSGWFSSSKPSNDSDDDDDDDDDDMTSAADVNAASHAAGQSVEARSAAIAAASGLANVKVQPSPGNGTPGPHTDVFTQPKPTSAAETSPVLPMAPADAGPIRPEQARAWAEELQLLERENEALRDRLHVGEVDPLADIKVDAVSQIRENVLRARVVELEKELDKMHMSKDPGDLPQKTTPSKPSASLSDDMDADAPATATP